MCETPVMGMITTGGVHALVKTVPCGTPDNTGFGQTPYAPPKLSSFSLSGMILFSLEVNFVYHSHPGPNDYFHINVTMN